VLAAPAPDAPATPARITMADATTIFLRNRESAQIAPATLRKYRTFTKQLTAYADGRGYVMIDQFTPADADQFYAGLKLGPRTKGTRLGVLRAFFRFAVNRKWMSETPVLPRNLGLTKGKLTRAAWRPAVCRAFPKITHLPPTAELRTALRKRDPSRPLLAPRARFLHTRARVELSC
jgi:hypothetical protein